jgi:hypothetical protein
VKQSAALQKLADIVTRIDPGTDILAAPRLRVKIRRRHGRP